MGTAAAARQPFFYGGQAVIEGVLMRGRGHYAVAARRKDGSIVVKQEPLTSRVYTSSVWKLPFLRGVAGLVEMLHLGMRALSWSANVQMEEEEIQLSKGAMRVTMSISIVFGLLLFVGLPLGAAALIHRGPRSVGFVVIEGVARAVILLGYLLLIGSMRSVGRVFEYHGAEHKTINCFESGDPLDVEHVRRASRLHPRCGTGFLVVVALVSIVVFAPLGGLSPLMLVLSRILLVPVVAAISYEGIRGLARIRDTAVGRVLVAPILATQLLTTREPDDRQMEVAIAAFHAARAGEIDDTPLPLAS
ncbi:MAG TPA: DUF1385 domain-containing protein [Candidatus Dormibacteraeota bacterium]|nr:DUF1385 domain-containing protein [Candidatus Dormibacteraeota bacterium]